MKPSAAASFFNVFPELVKHITLWNFYFSVFMAILIFYGSKLVIKWIIAVGNKCFLMNIFFECEIAFQIYPVYNFFDPQH